MKTLLSRSSVEEIAQNIARGMPEPARNGEGINTSHFLWILAQSASWSKEQTNGIDLLARQIDIRKTLCSRYDTNGEALGSNSITDSDTWVLALIVLFQYLVRIDDELMFRERRLRLINTLFKTAEHVVSPPVVVADLIDSLPDQIVNASKLPSPISAKAEEIGTFQSVGEGVRTIPITVLFYEGPIGRAYLATLKHLGMRPQRIINLISSRDLISKKPIGRWLPKGLRREYAANQQKAKIHFWPQKLQSVEPQLVSSICTAVERQFAFPLHVISEANGLNRLESYSDTVDHLLIDGLKDDLLETCLKKLPPSALLYTGGGIVPTGLLNLAQHRFIHVHPGYLPHIRGADCVLWSALLYQRLSASCFYMAPGIDTGDVIASHWLPAINVAMEDGNDTQTYYRAVYSYLDPWVRAYVLRQVILAHDRFDELETTPQGKNDGMTYHFMAPALQSAGIAALS